MNKNQQTEIQKAISLLNKETSNLEKIRDYNLKYKATSSCDCLRLAKAELAVIVAKQYVALLLPEYENFAKLSVDIGKKIVEISILVDKCNEEDSNLQVVSGLQ